MAIQFYKPNKNNTGHACSFSQSDKDKTIFATLLKQSGWDANKKIGVFYGRYRPWYRGRLFKR